MQVDAIYEAQRTFAGTAELFGVKDDNDIQKLVDEVRKISRAEAWSAFQELREQAQDVPEMSLDEINSEIKAVRAEKRTR